MSKQSPDSRSAITTVDAAKSWHSKSKTRLRIRRRTQRCAPNRTAGHQEGQVHGLPPHSNPGQSNSQRFSGFTLPGFVLTSDAVDAQGMPLARNEHVDRSARGQLELETQARCP